MYDENDEVPMDYNAILDDLQRQLHAGQAKFDAWEAEKAELVVAMEAMKKLAARQQQQISIPGISGRPTTPLVGPHTFRGLNYKDATLKVFDLLDKPLSAPDVTDVLFKAGYAGSRKLIKSNIDGVFKRLRDDRLIERVGETPTYIRSQPPALVING